MRPRAAPVPAGVRLRDSIAARTCFVAIAASLQTARVTAFMSTWQRPRPTTTSLARALLLLCAAVLLANLVAQPFRALTHQNQSDYLAFSAGARILHGGSACLYCPDKVAAVEADQLGFTPQGPGFPLGYYNPPLVAWVLQPISQLPLRAGLAVFLLTSGAALGAAAMLARRRLRGRVEPKIAAAVLVGGLASLPGAETIALGQWDAILLLAALAALAAVDRGWFFIGGLLLSVLLMKPQLPWLVIPALVAAQRWRMLAGVAAGAGAWALTGLAIAGAAQVRAWVDLVLGRQVGEVRLTAGLPGVAAVITGDATIALGVSIGLALVAAVVCLRLRRALMGRPADAVALGIALSIVCAPHIYAHDMLMLVVPLLAWARHRPLAAAIGAGALSVAYVLDAAIPGSTESIEALAALAVAVGVCRVIAALPRDALAGRLGGPQPVAA